MNSRIALCLLFILTIAGCKTPPPAPPPVTDDTLVFSIVNGVKLSHRHAIQPPATFTPINEAYRALYNAEIMTRPSNEGKVVTSLVSGETYTVLGGVEDNWLALAGENKDQLIGYVPLRAVVKSELYERTVRAHTRHKRAHSAKKTCVSVAGDSKACKNNTSGTWIID